MNKYKSPTKLISVRMTEDNLAALDNMSQALGKSKNELLNQAVLEAYVGKNLAVMRLHHT